MKRPLCLLTLLALVGLRLAAQPSFEGPVSSTLPEVDEDRRRAAYIHRVDEMIGWAAAGGKAMTDDPAKLDLAMIAAKSVRGEDLPGCSQRVIDLMREPGTGPFWMLSLIHI